MFEAAFLEKGYDNGKFLFDTDLRTVSGLRNAGAFVDVGRNWEFGTLLGHYPAATFLLPVQKKSVTKASH